MTRLREGIRLFNAGRYGPAAEVFRPLARSGDRNPALFLARSLLSAGRPAEAEAALRAPPGKSPGAWAALETVLRRARGIRRGDANLLRLAATAARAAPGPR